MMPNYVDRAGLKIAETLASFLESHVLPGLGLAADGFWQNAAEIFHRFTPENRTLLSYRDHLQLKIDNWHTIHRGKGHDAAAYQAFLYEIGYLADAPTPFTIGTDNVDDEVARIAGPQLVVPILNARFLLNAANARWGSLFDALYGTDVIPGLPQGSGYDPVRGAAVIERARQALDQAIPGWAAAINGGAHPALVGRRPGGLLFVHNGLHIELVIDREHPIGRTEMDGIADIILESALTTIADLEDSIAAVDAADKVAAYANWLGLMKGDLAASFDKAGQSITRMLAPDREWMTPDGQPLTLQGRSLMFVRNVGHLMTTPAVLMPDGAEAPEGILDGIVTSLIALYDLQGKGLYRNSRTGSIYIVKPKMHGPEEAGFADRLFGAIEDMLGLSRNTIKLGLMDEERRTSANLAACIHAIRNRVAFINTGFLDRTGDEIHTSMQAGPMVRKAAMKSSTWLLAYEERNVCIGLACGLSGRAQIGKGMWAMPDRMADMLRDKVAHPLSGATTAWVPSPTAATLHALHYHAVDVFAIHGALASKEVPGLKALLTLPLAGGTNWSPEEIRDEIDNNAQGILGYVVRWIDQGVGCSKVPDINDIGLMEDRATLRISSQHMANWLLHNIISESDVDAAFQRMAVRVDRQNTADPAYLPMADNWDTSLAYRAAKSLVFDGLVSPSGYTEPLLHAFRKEAKLV
ncbi:MAG: hypothetical protein RLZZ136_787 [Pseudomonadota bacterium]